MRKKVIYFVLLLVLFAGVSPITKAEASTQISSERLTGNDRFEVAVNVSKKGWPSGANEVFVANYLAFADALAASPFAFKQNAPILLTEPKSLNAQTKAEIQRLHPSKVTIIGGTGSVSNNIIDSLKVLGIKEVERISGKDRYEVAAKVAQKLGSPAKAVIANGLNFPDALSIAPYAAKNGFPILLTQSNVLNQQTDATIKQLGIKATLISGGEASVGKAVAANLPGVSRIGGANRFEVSTNIMNSFFSETANAFIATGMSFADALTGSVLAAKQNAPMLLVHPTEIQQTTKQSIANKGIANFVILGGEGSVPQNTFLKLTGQVGPLPLEGKDIVVDPGHGGYDSGASKNGYMEKNLNLQFAKKFGEKLKTLGANVIYTRTSDVYKSLEERTDFANSKNPDLFISIHHDSNTSSTPKGFSIHISSYRPAIEVKDVYVLSNGVKYPFIREDTDNKTFIVKYGSSTKSLSYMEDNIAYDPTPSPQAVESKTLAGVFAKSLVYPGIAPTTTYSSNGIRDSNLFVTRWTKMTSLLVELGFISNPTEVKLLANTTVQDKRADSLAQSIANYYENK